MSLLPAFPTAIPGPVQVTTRAAIPFTPPIRCVGGGLCQLEMDVTAPATGGPWPLIVLVPGGPQPLRDQLELLDSTIAPLLAQQGAVIMTIQWRQGLVDGAAFPAEVADVACAIGVARAVSSTYSGDPSRVTLVGHSLGGWAGAVLALTPSEYKPGANACDATTGSLRPDRFVGIAGALNAPTLVDDIPMSSVLGIDPADAAAADPFGLVERYPPGEPPLTITLIHGTADLDVPPEVSREFKAAASARGYVVDLVEIGGAEHHDVLTAAATITTIFAVATRD